MLNKTVAMIDMTTLPIPRGKTQFKYYLILTTLKDEFTAKIVILFDAVSINKKRKN
jgi:hypothetical protein